MNLKSSENIHIKSISQRNQQFVTISTGFRKFESSSDREKKSLNSF